MASPHVSVFRDRFGLSVRLTPERHRHILEHPEMRSSEPAIQETLAAPHQVVQSSSDPTARLYYRYYESTPVGPKHLCVVVKVLPGDAFVVTAYLTDSVKKGTVLWPAEA